MSVLRIVLSAVGFACVLLTVEPLPADAQNAGPGGPGAPRTKEQFDNMMANQWKHMVRGTTAALAEKQTAADLAAFTRNYYKALVEQGFSETEALALVGRISLPIGGARQPPRN